MFCVDSKWFRPLCNWITGNGTEAPIFMDEDSVHLQLMDCQIMMTMLRLPRTACLEFCAPSAMPNEAQWQRPKYHVLTMPTVRKLMSATSDYVRVTLPTCKQPDHFVFELLDGNMQRVHWWDISDMQIDELCIAHEEDLPQLCAFSTTFHSRDLLVTLNYMKRMGVDAMCFDFATNTREVIMRPTEQASNIGGGGTVFLNTTSMHEFGMTGAHVNDEAQAAQDEVERAVLTGTTVAAVVRNDDGDDDDDGGILGGGNALLLQIKPLLKAAAVAAADDNDDEEVAAADDDGMSEHEREQAKRTGNKKRKASSASAASKRKAIADGAPQQHQHRTSGSLRHMVLNARLGKGITVMPKMSASVLRMQRAFAVVAFAHTVRTEVIYHEHVGPQEGAYRFAYAVNGAPEVELQVILAPKINESDCAQ